MGLFGGWDLVLELCGPIAKNFWFYLKKKFTISRHKATPNRALSQLCAVAMVSVQHCFITRLTTAQVIATDTYLPYWKGLSTGSCSSTPFH